MLKLRIFPNVKICRNFCTAQPSTSQTYKNDEIQIRDKFIVNPKLLAGLFKKNYLKNIFKIENNF